MVEFSVAASEREIPRPAERFADDALDAHPSLVDRPLRTLKSGNAFAVLDSYGDLGITPDTSEGLFCNDTRHLSRLQLFFQHKRPLLLSSVIQDDNASLTVDLANPEITRSDGATIIPRDAIAIGRTKFLWNSVCYERIGLRNFDRVPHEFWLSLTFAADFCDLFEVRGMKRSRRGEMVTEVTSQFARFAYRGLDERIRRTVLRFSPDPSQLSKDCASFRFALNPGERTSLLVTVACDLVDAHSSNTSPIKSASGVPPQGFAKAYQDARRDLRALTSNITKIDATNTLFTDLITRSTSDLYTLMTRSAEGIYPYAGIPWFSTMFGRDGIITAMMLMWADPEVAKGVLLHLAKAQAVTTDPMADAQPGKILHERRSGEMANLGEVPFGFYYGSVDATPLFVMLAGQYFERTGDLATIERLWGHIQAALQWCDTYGDRDGDGFVEYYRETDSGLANQGWKDSHDSISHADGSLAQGPIALVEVQAYVYAAKRAAASMAKALGLVDRADELEVAASALRDRFDRAFWCEEIASYALALDGNKRPCQVRTSNAGHALFAGIALPERAAKVAATLMSESSFGGWGIRTLNVGEIRYNPMSYHNGSVWPHDNALIALGFAKYGFKLEAARLFEAIFDASTYQDQQRLPELFCGFLRRRRRGPTAYPVACSPQAWAAAAPFAMLAACLGLELPAASNEVKLIDPVLPAFLDDVTLRGLKLTRSQFDLRVHRHKSDVTINVLKRWAQSDASVLMLKTR
ncbi:MULTISPECIES: amylo-alpha-1,6-glucosidase [unclassified Bosea (in: a-proteobacteria)]|uniref:amylo-alpha-1,6-glucosidase n=1 Tax=unclassified Bosea (in: a-proteobacteria) TaxID=2653178 RepID=UPI000F7555D4|nr:MULTISPECIES: amylo-alpha-1,6-glucosidase [unclassified Bosea (in: a-proteobacteria)]AZO82020.1 amylo-alpha-1,6-glucosidase [Bosea sp. Tri-49]RXT16656.1 amylo-alpha-1,6-glucosidase [Bosea sp. Tri-39]RXT42423.1 amylo-alpha-1,6-glucosidase [Bosea sp. Tri-54]